VRCRSLFAHRPPPTGVLLRFVSPKSIKVCSTGTRAHAPFRPFLTKIKNCGRQPKLCATRGKKEKFKTLFPHSACKARANHLGLQNFQMNARPMTLVNASTFPPHSRQPTILVYTPHISVIHIRSDVRFLGEGGAHLVVRRCERNGRGDTPRAPGSGQRAYDNEALLIGEVRVTIHLKTRIILKL